MSWVRRFILFRRKRHTQDMGLADVNSFLMHLVVEARVAASTQNQAIGELLFLYGAGMRLSEALQLRVKNLDFVRNEVMIREAKGNKDRVTVLPQRVRTKFQQHLELHRRRHAEEVENDRGCVRVPYALERKYPGAGQSWHHEASRVPYAAALIRDPHSDAGE